MKIKTVLLIALMLCLLKVDFCVAGQTTIHLTATCVMPAILGYNTEPEDKDDQKEACVPCDPTPSGYAGNYELQKEERSLEAEGMLTRTKVNSNDKIQMIKQVIEERHSEKVRVYTICAR
jgi:hypothetical protein